MHTNIRSQIRGRLGMLAIVIIGLGFALQCIGAWRDSQTTDEAVHIAAGYSYWRTGDFRLNPEHPPLIKMWAALPLLAVPHLHFSTDQASWKGNNQWLAGAEFLYTSFPTIQGARIILFLARLPIILLWAGLAALLYWVAARKWGPAGGLLTLSFYVFDPNFLGHGHLVTTDIGLTAFFFATIVAADHYFSRPSRWSLLALSLLFGMTHVTKFSSIPLWVILPILGLIARFHLPHRFSWKNYWQMIAGMVLGFLFALAVLYGFQFQSAADHPGLNAWWVNKALPALGPDPAGWMLWLRRVPLLAPSYWEGFIDAINHNYWGHSAYLLGQGSVRGWWYYFPVAVAVKTPAITVLFLLLAAGVGLGRWRRRIKNGLRGLPLTVWIYGLPPLIFFGWSMTGHINIGVRHIFPIYPFLFLSLGSLVTVHLHSHRHVWRSILLSGPVLIALTALLAWPHTIAYFSEFIGGPAQGHRYLLDSNLEWSQDVWRLASKLPNTIEPRYVTLSGSLPIRNILQHTAEVPTGEEVAQHGLPKGTVAIGLGRLFDLNKKYYWLLAYQPKYQIGSSIWVYEFR